MTMFELNCLVTYTGGLTWHRHTKNRTDLWHTLGVWRDTDTQRTELTCDIHWGVWLDTDTQRTELTCDIHWGVWLDTDTQRTELTCNIHWGVWHDTDTQRTELTCDIHWGVWLDTDTQRTELTCDIHLGVWLDTDTQTTELTCDIHWGVWLDTDTQTTELTCDIHWGVWLDTDTQRTELTCDIHCGVWHDTDTQRTELTCDIHWGFDLRQTHKEQNWLVTYTGGFDVTQTQRTVLTCDIHWGVWLDTDTQRTELTCDIHWGVWHDTDTKNRTDLWHTLGVWHDTDTKNRTDLWHTLGGLTWHRHKEQNWLVTYTGGFDLTQTHKEHNWLVTYTGGFTWHRHTKNRTDLWRTLGGLRDTDTQRTELTCDIHWGVYVTQTHKEQNWLVTYTGGFTWHRHTKNSTDLWHTLGGLRDTDTQRTELTCDIHWGVYVTQTHKEQNWLVTYTGGFTWHRHTNNSTDLLLAESLSTSVVLSRRFSFGVAFLSLSADLLW